jgi:hypothetical protein
MSAVRKPENPDVIPMRPVEPAPDEPRFTTEAEMFEPPFWGKHDHSEADLRVMWSRIWRCFKSAELCKGFMKYNKVHTLERWSAAFEQVRIMKDDNFKYIRYVKKIADRYEIEGTPAEIARKEAEENQRRLDMKKQGNVRGMPDADDPDIVAFQKRSKPAPIEDMANHPVTQRIRNRNRGQ